MEKIPGTKSEVTKDGDKRYSEATRTHQTARRRCKTGLMLTRRKGLPSKAVATYSILATLLVILSATSVFAAPPRHNASAITEGTFNSGNYTFPDSINITNTFQAASTFFIDPITQRVGIRTNYPTQTLNVNGDVNVTGDVFLPAQSLGGCDGKLITDATGNVTCGADATGGGGMDYTNVAMTNQTNTFTAGQIVENTSAVDAYLNITDGDSPKFIVDAAGRVSVGTANPSSQLHVSEISSDDSVDTYGTQFYLNYSPSTLNDGWPYKMPLYTQLDVSPASGVSPDGLFASIFGFSSYTGDQSLNNSYGTSYVAGAYFDAAINNIQGGMHGNTTYLVGVMSDGVQSSPASTVANLIGVWGTADAHQGNTTNGYGVKAEVRVSPLPGSSAEVSKAYAVHAGAGWNFADYSEGGSAAITDYYGMYSERPRTTTSGYVIQNAYGMYIENFSARGNATDFNLYSDGENSKNYFAGSVGIGTAAPNFTLDVYGDTNTTGLLMNVSSCSNGLVTNAEGLVYCADSPVGSSGTSLWGEDSYGIYNYTANVSTAESVNLSGILYVDKSSGRAGINTTNPEVTLDVNGEIKGEGLLLGSNVNPSRDTYWTKNQVMGTVTEPFHIDDAYYDWFGVDLVVNFTSDQPELSVEAGSIVGSTDPGCNGSFVQLHGGILGASHYGSGEVRDIKGLFSGVHNVGAGTSNDSMAGQFVYANMGTGSITNAYGIFVESPSNDASNNNITNAYGIYIQEQNRGTNKWNLYSIGGRNYFGGGVGINTTIPVQLLDVDGVMRLAPTNGPGDCNSTLKGSMYFDDSMSEPCFCNSTDWSQFDGGGICD